MKPILIIALLQLSTCCYASDKSSNQTLRNHYLQNRSAVQEIRRTLSTNKSTDIHTLFQKLINDSSHYYFNVTEINDYATSLLKQQLPLAISILNETLRSFPKSIETAVLLGEAYEQAGDKYLARQVYEEALLMKPDPTMTYILLKKVSLLVKID